MKRALLMLWVLFTITGVCNAELKIDISGSQYETQSSDTVRLGNIALTGYPGRYWADFKWDSDLFMLVPVNGGVQTVTPPSEDLQGSYVLLSFVAQYSNGTTLTEQSVPISGTMSMGPSSMTQSLTVNGQPMSQSGTYSIMFRNRGGGTMSVTADGETRTVTYWTLGYAITTYSGLVQLESGTFVEEWDTWTKTSDIVQ